MSKGIEPTEKEPSLGLLKVKLDEIEYSCDEQFKTLAQAIADSDARVVDKAFQVMIEDQVKRAALLINIDAAVKYTVWRIGAIMIITGIIAVMLSRVIWG
jgi:hypothetical protein